MQTLAIASEAERRRWIEHYAKREDPATTQGRARRAAAMLRRGHTEIRAFDDCFEMGDGDEVFSILARRAAQDDGLYRAIRRHGFADWIEKIDRIKDQGAASSQFQPPLWSGAA